MDREGSVSTGSNCAGKGGVDVRRLDGRVRDDRALLIFDCTADTSRDSVTVGNLRAALSVVRLLASHGVANQLRWPQEVLAVDFNGRNIVFIGAFNNPWTMSLNKNLRFTFELSGTPDKPIWMIREQTSPNRKWLRDKTDPEPIDHDYALITRILDPARKRVVISAGG